MPSIPFLNQQDLQHFVAPPDERQANLTIKEIATAYTPQDTASLMNSITTLTNRMWELGIRRKQQSHLEKWLGME